MEIALVLVDIQNDYFPGGRNPLYNSPYAKAGFWVQAQSFSNTTGLNRSHINLCF
jgi:nicotinamidase-related amidase